MSRDSALRTLEIEAKGLEELRAAMAGPLGAAFEAAVEACFRAAGRVIVTGMGKSGHIARKIAATMASTGTPSLYLHPGEASHGDLGMVTARDVILALSWSGETVELRDIINYSRRYGVKLIAITAGADSALGRAADVVLLLPRVAEACPLQLAPTSSTLIQMALGDAIAMALLDRRGFSPTDFQQFHPGGKLGAQLATVGELMAKGEELPLVRQDDDMAKAVLVMTRGSLGCAVVVDDQGEVVGIVTDGDLRRHMGPDLMVKPVQAVMTPNPRGIRPDVLASAALAEMNARRISVLIVQEGRWPVGVLHMHALLTAGVA
jgi:arabinose-5-phosphate isomerase